MKNLVLKNLLARWLVAMGFLIFAIGYGAVIAIFLASIIQDLRDREDRRQTLTRLLNPTPDYVDPMPHVAAPSPGPPRSE